MAIEKAAKKRARQAAVPREPEGPPNPAVERFVVEFCDGNQSAAADALGCGRIHVWRMIKGHRRVTPDMAAAIEKMTRRKIKRAELVWPEG